MPGAHEASGKMPGTHMMFTDEEHVEIKNDMIGGDHIGVGAAEVDASEDEIKIIEVMDTDTDKYIDKRKAWGPTVGTHHSKWKSLEDGCLIDSWKAVSLAPIADASQTLGTYYALILDEFNEHRHIGEYLKIHMNCNEGAISHR
jgi:hypothetical protein